MRRVGRAVLAAGLLSLLTACMTAYQPYGVGGGYKEEKLDDDTYRVSFYGNGNTPRGVVLKYFLYRCAELTLQHGYTYFELFAAERQQQSLRDSPFVKVRGSYTPPTVTYVPPTTYTMWRAIGIIRMYPDDMLMPGPTLFSAREVIAGLGPEVRSGAPDAQVPGKFHAVEGKFPVMSPRKQAAETPSDPSAGGPVRLEDLQGLMPGK